MKSHKKYIEIKERAEIKLLKVAGVHAVGLGSNYLNGKATNETAIHVYVDKKQLLTDTNIEDILEKSYEDIPVYIIYSEQSKPHKDENKYRPLQGGAQIQIITSMNCCSGKSSSGTLGCLVKRNSDDAVMILTNQHVLDGIDGSDVFQPKVNITQCCKGYCCERDVVASPDKMVLSDDVDGATAKLDGTDWNNDIIDIGTIRGTHTITLAEASSGTYRLRKRGRTTGLTSANCTSINVSGNRTDGWHFKNQIAVNDNFGDSGDSGSVVVNDNNEIVALYWGGSKTSGKASPIADVVSQLGITVMIGEQSGAYKKQDVVDVDNGGKLYRQITDELESYGNSGQTLLKLYNEHHAEVLHLINHIRPVTVTWHRQNGAAFAKLVFDCFEQYDLKIPTEVNGMQMKEALEKIASSLYDHASVSLKIDLLKHKDGIISVLGKSINEIKNSLNEYIQPLVLKYT